MIKFFLVLAAVSALPVAAQAAERTFTRDGVTYVYTTEVIGKATLITGHSLSGGTFRLTVRNGAVSGISDGVPVDFKMPSSGTAKTTELSMR